MAERAVRAGTTDDVPNAPDGAEVLGGHSRGAGPARRALGVIRSLIRADLPVTLRR